MASRDYTPSFTAGTMALESPDTMTGDGNKTAEIIDAATAQAYDELRSRTRHQDRQIENQPATTRAAKDRDRSYPRSGNPPDSQPKPRSLPTADEARLPATGYACKTRSKVKNATENALARTERDAVDAIITNSKAWARTNRRLTQAATTGPRLNTKERIKVQRVDRAIRKYEKHNDREHVSYVGIAPGETLTDAGKDWATTWAAPGQRFGLNQFTSASLNPHTANNGEVLLEIHGDRGMYLGGSAPGENAEMLLPRGIDIEVVSVHEADIVGPDGISRTTIIQAKIIDD